MRILAIFTAEYGLRHIANIQAHQPAHWSVDLALQYFTNVDCRDFTPLLSPRLT
jgi:hypothetical protein